MQFRFHIAANLKKQLLTEFWCNIKEEFLQLYKKDIKIFLPFSTTQLYVVGFSSSISNKTIYYNRLNVEAFVEPSQILLSQTIKRFA